MAVSPVEQYKVLLYWADFFYNYETYLSFLFLQEQLGQLFLQGVFLISLLGLVLSPFSFVEQLQEDDILI